MKIKLSSFAVALLVTLVTFYIAARSALIYGVLKATNGDTFVAAISETMNQLLPSLKATPFYFDFTQQSLYFGGACALLVFMIFMYQLTNYKNYRHGEEYGSAKWADKSEIKPYVDKEADGNILFTATESKTIKTQLKGRKRKYERNNNVVVIGGSGSGKTRNYVIPNLLQMHSSYVVTDSKGAILRDTGQLFKEAGYKIKVYDLVNRINTDGYNCFHYIEDEDDILETVANLMANTSDPNQKGGDKFWEDAQRLFLCAIFHLLLLDGSPEEQNMTMVNELRRRNKVKDDDEDYVSGLDLLFKDVEERHGDCFAVRQYENFKQAAGKTAKSILISLGVRMMPFDVPSVERITKIDTLELDKLGDTKTILYLVLPDSDSPFNFIVSMVYQQMFKILKNKADNFYGGMLPVPVRAIMDEFANIGQIPNVHTEISVVRSRGISIEPILQDLTQISKKLYKDTWGAIVGNCDSFLFLGGNEEKTNEYISKRLGKETIDLLNTNETRGQSGSWTKQHSKTGRDLLSPDEVGRLDNSKCIFMLRGTNPFFSDKLDVTKHRRYKELENTKGKFVFERIHQNSKAEDPSHLSPEQDQLRSPDEQEKELDEFLANTAVETLEIYEEFDQLLDEELETIEITEIESEE
ncbi:VirD4-like conjugal transfer protein, CD1115 family [Candidatus Enterococcus ferrettii]|uniref:Type IV secretion system protein VirD4 n=1 Tax=Candidatus Enterococcus ferrettii TaxID=2815324 RepID=A0ABV0EZW6_9ENTE|nr:type IV secretory system conjugative DNA transfer family protein [Enterococcus sp. 665A]MBO1340281.1 type IV secretory system conjugative DNA transfer family protein [Enterococcus sp. 665A]